jgi:hypothetical protein
MLDRWSASCGFGLSVVGFGIAVSLSWRADTGRIRDANAGARIWFD